MIVEGVSGAVTGGFAGYLGAKCAILKEPIIQIEKLNEMKKIRQLADKDALKLDKILEKINSQELTLDDVKLILAKSDASAHNCLHNLDDLTSKLANNKDLLTKASHGFFLNAEQQHQLVWKALNSPEGIQFLSLLQQLGKSSKLTRCLIFSVGKYMKEMSNGTLSFTKEMSQIKIIIKHFIDGAIRIQTSFPVLASVNHSYHAIIITLPELIQD